MSDFRGDPPGHGRSDVSASRDERFLYVVSRDVLSPSEDETISLLALLRTLRCEWRIVAAVTLVSVLVATLIALLATPLYRASALLAPVEHDAGGRAGMASLAGQLGGLVGLSGVSLGGEDNVSTTIATLESRRFLAGLVRDLNLKPVLFADRWDPGSKAWIAEPPGPIDTIRGWLLPAPAATESDEKLLPGEPTGNETYALLTEEVLSVEQDPTTSLITVSIDWRDPVIAATWTNALVARANAELRGRAIQDAERSIAYLTQQTALTDKPDLQASLFELIREQMKAMTVARTQVDYALQVIDPAVAPDATDRIWPRRGLLVLLGTATGLFLGALVALLTAGIRNSRRAPDGH